MAADGNGLAEGHIRGTKQKGKAEDDSGAQERERVSAAAAMVGYPKNQEESGGRQIGHPAIEDVRQRRPYDCSGE